MRVIGEEAMIGFEIQFVLLQMNLLGGAMRKSTQTHVMPYGADRTQKEMIRTLITGILSRFCAQPHTSKLSKIVLLLLQNMIARYVVGW